MRTSFEKFCKLGKARWQHSPLAIQQAVIALLTLHLGKP